MDCQLKNKIRWNPDRKQAGCLNSPGNYEGLKNCSKYGVILFVSKLAKGVSDISYTRRTVHTKYRPNILFFISKYFVLSLFTV